MRVLLKCLGLLLLASTALAVVTVEPSHTPAGQTKTKSDPRLAQVVTIECANLRLHSVLDQISAKTGVTIRCGKNKDDWQVRDLPVFVAVKDIRLDKLLKALAECTHTALSRERVGDSISYRIIQNTKIQAEVDAYFAASEAAWAERQRQDWDTVGGMKDIANVKADPADRCGSLLVSTGIAGNVASVISALGANTRDKVLSGDVVWLGNDNVPETCREALRGVMRGIHQYCTVIWSGNVQGEPTEQMLDKGHLGIWTVGGGEDGSGAFFVYMDMGQSHQNIQLSDFARVAQYSKGEKPADIDEGLPRVEGQLPDRWRPFSDSPFWERKVKLDALKDPKRATAADVMLELSRAAGLNIITEDFVSHATEGYESKRMLAVPGREICIPAGVPYSCAWRVDDDGKTIIGYAGSWVSAHRSLMPESIYDNLRKKANGAGIELEDVLPLVDINDSQGYSWIGLCRDLSNLTWHTSRLCASSEDKPLWSLYYRLSPADKALAAGKDGLPLATLDPKVVSDAAALRVKRFSRQFDPDKEYLELQKTLAGDAELLRHGVMRLYRDERPSGRANTLTLSAEKGGKAYWMGTGELRFPIYSPDREAELAKKASEGTSPSPPKR